MPPDAPAPAPYGAGTRAFGLFFIGDYCFVRFNLMASACRAPSWGRSALPALRPTALPPRHPSRSRRELGLSAQGSDESGTALWSYPWLGSSNVALVKYRC